MSDMLYGYAGKILRVDLSTGAISTEPITKYVPQYIGGRMLGARLYWDEIKPEADALSPDNKLIFLSGPLTGTGAQGGGRSCLVTKAAKGYPKKTYWHGTAGNQFGTELKYAGYDVLIVQGASEKPVSIIIQDDKVRIVDAAKQWGMLVGPARAEFKRIYGEKSQTAIIGPAGENRVVHAGISTEYGSGFSQGGTGAVMGSKNLKAIVVNGTGKLNVARPKDLMKIMSDKIDWIAVRYGETKDMDGKTIVGKKNLGTDFFGGNDWVSKATAAGELRNKGRSCAGCASNCRRSIQALDGSLQTGSVECAPVVFYMIQEMAVNGPAVMNGKLSHKMMDLCEDLGLDAFYPFHLTPWFGFDIVPNILSRGIINQENTGMLLDQYGSEEFGRTFLENLAYRRGWGKLLADGDEKAIDYVVSDEKFGPNRHGAKEAYEGTYMRKGDFNGVDFHTLCMYMDDPDYNLRLLVAQTDVKRAKEFEPGYHKLPNKEIVKKWIGTDKILEPHYWGPEIAEAALLHEAYGMEQDSLGLCTFASAMYPFGHIKFGTSTATTAGCPETPNSGADYWNAIMGTDISQEELCEQFQVGRNIEAAIIAREATHGKNRENFQYHDWIHEKLSDKNGVKSMPKEDFERTLSQYFALRGWDENGIPTRETLEKYGLKDIADELDARGVR